MMTCGWHLAGCLNIGWLPEANRNSSAKGWQGVIKSAQLLLMHLAGWLQLEEIDEPLAVLQMAGSAKFQIRNTNTSD